MSRPSSMNGEVRNETAFAFEASTLCSPRSSAEQKLYIPGGRRRRSGQLHRSGSEGMQLTKKLNTVRSAKDLFFPQVENLVGFRVTGKQLDLVETRDPAEPFVLFGVRACDARSFEILDRVFLCRAAGHLLRRPPRARHRRDAGLHPAGGDLLLSGLRHRPGSSRRATSAAGWTSEALYWQANTEKGEALTAKLSMLEDADERSRRSPAGDRRARSSKSCRWQASTCPPSARGRRKRSLTGRNGSSSRKAASAAARAPSSARPASATTSRNSTPASSSAASAAGTAACTRTSPRCPPVSRARPSSSASASVSCTSWSISRITTTGCFGCVGCGRCLAKCPIHMNIVKVVKTLGEETT